MLAEATADNIVADGAMVTATKREATADKLTDEAENDHVAHTRGVGRGSCLHHDNGRTSGTAKTPTRQRTNRRRT
jgi:hypothetical protein